MVILIWPERTLEDKTNQSDPNKIRKYCRRYCIKKICKHSYCSGFADCSKEKYACFFFHFARQTNVYVTGELTMYECKSSNKPLQVNRHKHKYSIYIKMYIHFVLNNTFHWREFRNHFFFGYCKLKGLYPIRSRWKHGRVDITIPVFALWSLERGMTLYRLTCVRKERTNTLYRNSQSCQNEAWTELQSNGTEVGKNSL